MRHSAFGILQLEYISRVKEKRGKVASKYKEELKGIDGIKIFGEEKDIIYNNSYFPVLIEKKQNK